MVAEEIKFISFQSRITFSQPMLFSRNKEGDKEKYKTDIWPDLVCNKTLISLINCSVRLSHLNERTSGSSDILQSFTFYALWNYYRQNERRNRGGGKMQIVPISPLITIYQEARRCGKASAMINCLLMYLNNGMLHIQPIPITSIYPLIKSRTALIRIHASERRRTKRLMQIWYPLSVGFGCSFPANMSGFCKRKSLLKKV